jgi:hypothetical protein
MGDRTPEEIAMHNRLMKLSKRTLALLVRELTQSQWTPRAVFEACVEGARMRDIQLEICELREQQERIDAEMMGLLRRLWASPKGNLARDRLIMSDWEALFRQKHRLSAREQALHERWHKRMQEKTERIRRA